MNRKERALEFVNEGYDIQITGRHVEVTEAMKNYALEKISKIERFTDRIIEINAIMDIQKLDHRVEIIIKFGNLKISATATSTDMYASIDKAVSKIESQLRRYKSKIQDHHARKLAVIDMNVNVLRRAKEEEFDLEEEEFEAKISTAPHAIIKQETRPLKTLTHDEAVMKMELSGDGFLIFKSEEDQKIKVIYRRSDDNFGIIEPKY